MPTIKKGSSSKHTGREVRKQGDYIQEVNV